MNTWIEHSVADAEHDWQTLRTNGKRWQLKISEEFDTCTPASKVVNHLIRLTKKYYDVTIESEYTFCGEGSCSRPVIVYWKDMGPRNPLIKYVGESDRDRFRRRDKYLHAKRMEDPVYRKIHEAAVAEIHKEMQENAAKAFKRFDRIFKKWKKPLTPQ